MTTETYKPDPDQGRESNNEKDDDDYDPVAILFDEILGVIEVEALNDSIEAFGSQINTSRD